MKTYNSRTDFVLSSIHEFKEGKILDIGFIGGYSEPFIHNAILLNMNGSIVGIDVSDKIDSMKGNEKVKYFKKSVYEIMGDPIFEGQFNVVVMCEVIEHLDYPWKAFENAISALAEGGALVLTYPNPYALEKLIKYFLVKDVSSKSFIDVFLGAPDHLHFPTLPGMLRHAAKFGMHPEEITFLKGLGSRLPFMNRFAGYVGVALRKGSPLL